MRARKFVVEMRAKKPIVIIDAYYDGEGQALCPAATGISHHINPWGDIEPCPIVQFTKESIHSTEADPRPLKDKFLQSAFLRDFRELAAETTRGCIVLERPDLLKKLVEATARRTRPRGNGAGGTGGDDGAHVAVQPGDGDSGEERLLPAGEAVLVQRLRRLPRPRCTARASVRAGRAGEVMRDARRRTYLLR